MHYLPQVTKDQVPGRKVVLGGEVPSRWWEAFRSRGLNRLIEEALVHNADLHAAEAAVRIAQANALVQRGALWPSLTGQFTSTRQQEPTATLASNAASGVSLYTVHTAQVTVSYVPDVWGGTRRQIETADAQAENQAFQREGVYLTLSTNVALAAIQEASLRGQIAATRRLITTQTELLGIFRRQNQAGQIALPEVAVQETALAQTKLLLPPLERQLGQQRHLLATLTGRAASEDAAATFQLSAFTLPRKLPLSLPADLVRQRPDVRAAEATLHANNAQIGVAIANRLPQITLTGNGGSAADKLSRLFSPGTNFWSLSGNVLQTIFDAGILENKQRMAEETVSQSAAQYRSTVLAAFQNVADVLRALQADAQAVNAAIEAEQAATRSMELVRKQVELGQFSLPVLLTTQQAFLQTSINRVQAEASRFANTVALFQALGGGWWNRPEIIAKREAAVEKIVRAKPAPFGIAPEPLPFSVGPEPRVEHPDDAARHKGAVQ